MFRDFSRGATPFDAERRWTAAALCALAVGPVARLIVFLFGLG